MKQKFNKNWKSSKQPRKQRKYSANTPLHLKNKAISANLSKELRKKHGRRSAFSLSSDRVRIMTGKFRKKEGKITKVLLKTSKIIIEDIQIKKKDGSKVDVKMEPSNLRIIELNSEDKKRLKNREKKMKPEKKQEEKNAS
ncbi:MAG: 50S ribosomal protein L24 [Candidatus Pacearchaeota archaeon]|nr:50S ribosomal protein L24 [Candidatus Pacearchaeota archaeon]